MNLISSKRNMNIVILTGNEIRHKYFRIRMANDKRFHVINSFCEDQEKSLSRRISNDNDSSQLMKKHAFDRNKSEEKFFLEYIKNSKDLSNPMIIKKGAINDREIVFQIDKLSPDLIICYGTSIIKSYLIEKYKKRFLNVHLGLSPYYRGSGTNIFPIINKELHMIGTTFMYLNEGIDTGKIIHQFRANIHKSDSLHEIGNRLITNMTEVFSDIIYKFNYLTEEKQPGDPGKVYTNKDFNNKSCELLYDLLSNGIIREYKQKKEGNLPYIVTNAGLKK